MADLADEHFDVVIVGAGLSGVGAGYHLQAESPGRSYVILEGRDAIGGTWDLFRYPGIRSDSDMFTLGYAFEPWTESKAIADGPSILSYVKAVAADYGIDRHIRFGHKVVAAAWSSEDAQWTVEARRGEVQARFTCKFLFLCGGYYSYASGYTPEFPGAERFRGRIVHPQFWPQDLDYAGKRVVVIGSGATAVTLVPAMARTAGHVVMLQRSPTYYVSRPAEDRLANWLRTKLPAMLAYRITRWRNVLLQQYFFRLARGKPQYVKERLIGLVAKELGPDYDVATHFTPRYNPWDQRLCLVPDADLFEEIRAGHASIVTDHIESFTESGLRLKSGAELAADIIVTATGLNMEVWNGLAVSVDGRAVDAAKAMSYKGMMCSDVPNFATTFGYTNASWTLKSDLTAGYVCRLLNHMARTGYRQATPRYGEPERVEEPWLDFSSGYVTRAMARFPKQGAKAPWRAHQNYALDLMNLKFSAVEDGVMEFSNKPPATVRELAPA